MSRLRVILVEIESTRTSTVSELLNIAECELVARFDSVGALIADIRKVAAELVVVSVDTPTVALMNELIEVQGVRPTPVVLFARDDGRDTIHRAVQSGVSAYVVDGVEPGRTRPILEAAMARFRQFHALAEELQRTRGQLQERKVIERAKGIIMAQRGLSEDAAYKLMRKTAMDRNKRMVDIADSIIAASDLLGSGAPAPAMTEAMPLSIA